MKDFFEFREGRVNELSAKLLNKAADKADAESDKAHHAKDRGRAGKKYDQATRFHKGAKDARRRAIRRGEKVHESAELDEQLNAPSVQTKYGIVTVSKRDTKGMRGKQDGFKLTLKTKSGKTVDLGSHPRPTDANIKSIAKNVMEK